MSSGSAPRPSVLVVDDSPENLRLLSTILTDNGYEVRPVTSGRQALQTAERAAPDLVLLDISMPSMNGITVCRQFKEREQLRDIPVIFLTALTETADKLEAFAAGGVDFIAKPFQVEEVVARVRVHVDLRRARQELARHYERLRELEKVRDDLVHMIVHDMRSPLQGVLTLLATMRRQVREGEMAETLDDAVYAARELGRMANDLLDVSRLEQGKMPLEMKSCDLIELAREVVINFPSDEMRQVIVENGKPASVECDAGLVRRVLENLVSNGIKHTPAGTEVRVSAVTGETAVRVQVRDNGGGVPAEVRQRIFEKFGGVRTRANGDYHSVGLGLAFCKLAVQAHGGAIGVEDAEGGGSVFWFDLPRKVTLPGRTL